MLIHSWKRTNRFELVCWNHLELIPARFLIIYSFQTSALINYYLFVIVKKTCNYFILQASTKPRKKQRLLHQAQVTKRKTRDWKVWHHLHLSTNVFYDRLCFWKLYQGMFPGRILICIFNFTRVGFSGESVWVCWSWIKMMCVCV